MIEQISTSNHVKRTCRCPSCKSSGIKARRTLKPRFRCHECRTEFEEPTTIEHAVRSYRSRHDAGWIDLAGSLSGPELRRLCLHPASQLSIRALRWDEFRSAVARATDGLLLRVVDARARQLTGGHGQATVRLRRGQPAFRTELLPNDVEVADFED